MQYTLQYTYYTGVVVHAFTAFSIGFIEHIEPSNFKTNAQIYFGALE